MTRRASAARSAKAYLPEDWRQSVLLGRPLPELTHGSALFADISGFTPLTEALTLALGARRGSEQLSHHLNQVFDSLIADVNRYGGSVISFAGDAITCWFSEEMPEGCASPPALRAAACALALQRSMRQFAVIAIPGHPPVSLAVRTSVASGPARRFVVGNPAVQLIPVLAGITVARMAAGDHHANKGEAVVDEPTMAILGERAKAREWRTDDEAGWRFAVVEKLLVQVPFTGWPSLPRSSSGDKQVRSWVLPAIYRRLQAGLGEFLTELRPAVALFLSFGGIDFDDDPDAGHKLDAYTMWVQQAAARYDGTLLHLGYGDKGSYCYITFGAPIAHEDDASRACNTALDLLAPQPDLEFMTEARIGIAGGTILAGAYGGSTRRTYGTLGDAVNMAARLMQAAPVGEAMVSQSVRQAAARDFDWESLPPLTVKGKSEPMAVSRLLCTHQANTFRLQEPRDTLPMVGREEQMAQVAQKMHEALQGRGHLVGITAEAGMGKSRLMAEVVELFNDRGLRCYGGECQSYGANTAYLAWRAVWQAMFGLDMSCPLVEQLRTLEARLRMVDSALVPRLPLLGVLLNLPIPDNDLTRSFEAKLRKTSLEALLVDCLRAQGAKAPLALILEDCHWLDPLSDDLLEVIARSIADLPILVVLAYRPPSGTAGRAPLQAVSRLPHFTKIELPDLSPEQVEGLVASKLERLLGPGVTVPSLLLERITDRAQGNPFYVEELMNYLNDRGIDPRDPRAIESLDLPTSLHSLVLSRIDQVTESQKITLKVASIIGRLFRFNWLWGVYPELGPPERVKSDLDGLARLDITNLEQPEPELTYLFKHIVTQEVAYESQPYSARTALHGQLGQFIERTYGDASGQFLDLLAFHYDHSENHAKRKEYLRKAGEAAQKAYANAVAIDYYRRVLPLLSDHDLLDVRLRLGQVLELAGQWGETDEQYQLALTLAEGLKDLIGQAQALRAIGWLLRKRGEYVEAHEFLARARAVSLRARHHAGVTQALADVGEVYRLQGLYEEARASYEESLRLAEDVPQVELRAAVKAQALKGSGTVASLQGDHALAASLFEESLAIQRDLGNRPGVGVLLNNLGIVARHQGNLLAARKINDDCLALFRELGDKWVLGYLLNNQGCVLSDLGDYPEARRLLLESLEVGRQLGDKARVARSLNSLADVALDQGSHEEARAFLEESLTLSIELGDRTAIAYLFEDYAGLAAALGQPELALKLAGFAESLREANDAPLAPQEQKRLEHMIEPARRALGAGPSGTSWNEGKAMVFDDAVACAKYVQHAKS